MSKNSRTWNDEFGAGDVIAGAPAGAGPIPVTVKLRTADHGESKKPFGPWSWDAFTRQKYVPLGSPLSDDFVGRGTSPSKLVKPDAITVENVELVPTCQV